MKECAVEVDIDPVSKSSKSPVNPNTLADFVSSKLRKQGDWLLADDNLYDELYQSISRMVYKICNKHSWILQEDICDLVQDCMLRVIKYMHTYDPSIAGFSTWCWIVCVSVLRNKYRSQGYRIKEVHLKEIDTFDRCVSISQFPTPISIDIADAVDDLIKENPDKKDVIFEMFGNPQDHDFRFPTDINVAATAKAMGKKYSEIRYFYCSVVRPFFKERFKDKI